MVIVTIQRTEQSDSGTQGRAVVTTFDRSKQLFDTLEPPWRDNSVSSCIPAGVYVAYLHRVPVLGVDHPQYHRVYELQGVPDRKHIEIDRGHFAGDVKLGLVNDMLGAIAFGFGFGMRSPGKGFEKQLCLQHSARGVARLVSCTQGAGIRVEILDP